MPVPGPSPRSPTSSVPGIGELPGLWRRTLLAVPGGACDTSTWAGWLQGPSYYVDLRQPAGFGHPATARGLGDLSGGQLSALAGQEAFAGRLCREGEVFHWRRAVDLRPSVPLPDMGRLSTAGGLLVEEGVHEAYVEHWRRDDPLPERAADTGQAAAALLYDPDSGRTGLLVRAGSWFGYVRGRDPLTCLPPGARLGELLAGSTAEAAGRLLDCEVSLGHARPDGWTVRRSILPGRAGRRFACRAVGDRLVADETGPYGAPVSRRWRVVDAEGHFPLLLSDPRDPEALS